MKSKLTFWSLVTSVIIHGLLVLFIVLIQLWNVSQISSRHEVYREVSLVYENKYTAEQTDEATALAQKASSITEKKKSKNSVSALSDPHKSDSKEKKKSQKSLVALPAVKKNPRSAEVLESVSTVTHDIG